MSKDFLKDLMELSAHDPHKETIRNTYKRAPFGWPGGKYRSLETLLPLLPYRESYIEHCGGSGVVLLNRRRSPLEVFNDRFSGVTTFYRCLQDRAKQDALAKRLDIMCHSREEFVWNIENWQNYTDDVERAARWFYTVKTSFGSIGRHWGRSTNCPNMIGPKLREAAKEFPWVHYRIRDIQIENLDLIQSIKDYDNTEAVHYIDPDYLDSARGHYKHEMDRAKHVEILEAVFHGRGFFAVSGYPNSLYEAYPWTAKHTWQSFVTASHGAFTETNNHKEDRATWVRDYATEVLYVKDHTS